MVANDRFHIRKRPAHLAGPVSLPIVTQGSTVGGGAGEGPSVAVILL
jgi:hypothetical protein